eukprot:6199290-Pleurochrysis_carterae.AAC.1
MVAASGSGAVERRRTRGHPSVAAGEASGQRRAGAFPFASPPVSALLLRSLPHSLTPSLPHSRVLSLSSHTPLPLPLSLSPSLSPSPSPTSSLFPHLFQKRGDTIIRIGAHDNLTNGSSCIWQTNGACARARG